MGAGAVVLLGSVQPGNWRVLVLKDATWFHLLPSGISSGECPLYTRGSAFRFIVVILIRGTAELINRRRVSAERGDVSSSHVITPW